MHKAKKLFPELEKGAVHLTDGCWNNDLRDDVPLWLIRYDKTVPEYLRCCRNDIPEWYDDAEQFRKEWNNHHNPGRIRSGIEELTNYTENDKAEWIISINEKGKELLRWFCENES